MDQSFFVNPFQGQRYELGDGRWLELGDIYFLAYWRCRRSKYPREAEDFAMWCLEKAITKGKGLGKNAHLNNIGWLFSEWLYTFKGEGKPGARPNKVRDNRRLGEKTVSINKLENILFEQECFLTSEEIQENEAKAEQKEMLLKKLHSFIISNRGRSFKMLVRMAKVRMPFWEKGLDYKKRKKPKKTKKPKKLKLVPYWTTIKSKNENIQQVPIVSEPKDCVVQIVEEVPKEHEDKVALPPLETPLKLLSVSDRKEKVVKLAQQGFSLLMIAKELGIGVRTARRDLITTNNRHLLQRKRKNKPIAA